MGGIMHEHYVPHLLAVCVVLCVCGLGHTHGTSEDHNHRDDLGVDQNEDLKAHLKGVADIDVNSMGHDERMFYFFHLHDFDNNTKLDGLELIKAIQHTRGNGYINTKAVDNPEFKTQEQKQAEIERRIIEASIKGTERIIVHDDDNDGYLTFQEFMSALNEMNTKAREKEAKSQ